MLLWFSTLALAGEDAEDVALLESRLVAFDQSIRDAEQRVLTGSLTQEEARELAERLNDEAVELRPLGRKLTLLEQHLDDDKKLRKAHGEQIAGFRDRISVQRKQRGRAVDLLRGWAALADATTDPDAWRKVGTAYVGVAESPLPLDDAPDAWLFPALDQAVEASQWAFVQGAATWCTRVCTDKDKPVQLLEKVPPDTRPDFRWTKVNAP